jgi:hypothetical protein
MVEILLSLLVALMVVAALWLALRTLSFRLAGLRSQVSADSGRVLGRARGCLTRRRTVLWTHS